MKIAVCIDTGLVSQNRHVAHIQKIIQSPAEDINTIIEPSSVAALQMADALAKEEDSITAITYGGSNNLPALEYALALGISSVIHLTNEKELANASDSQGTAIVIATWLKKQDFDLVVCGNPSGTGLVPSLIAGYLEIPCVPRVYNASQNKSESLELYQHLERGWRQRVSVQLPAVVTVQAGSFPTTYVSVKRRRIAHNNIHTVQVVSSNKKDATGISLKSVTAPRTRAKRTAIPDATASAQDRLQSLIGGIGGGLGATPKPPPSKQKEKKGIIETTPEKAAKEIISFLEEKELLPENLSK